MASASSMDFLTSSTLVARRGWRMVGVGRRIVAMEVMNHLEAGGIRVRTGGWDNGDDENTHQILLMKSCRRRR